MTGIQDLNTMASGAYPNEALLVDLNRVDHIVQQLKRFGIFTAKKIKTLLHGIKTSQPSISGTPKPSRKVLRNLKKHVGYHGFIVVTCYGVYFQIIAIKTNQTFGCCQPNESLPVLKNVLNVV